MSLNYWTKYYYIVLLQAANSADFSIAQFRFLSRLLFVHGAWNYSRISKVSHTFIIILQVLFNKLFLDLFSELNEHQIGLIIFLSLKILFGKNNLSMGEMGYFFRKRMLINNTKICFIKRKFVCLGDSVFLL